MALAVFPWASLPGISWPVNRSPTWHTIKQKSMSGKRTAFALQASPTYDYELTINVLRGASAYAEYQKFRAFYNSLSGGQGMFAFYDPADHVANAQAFGTGNSISTTFPLVRAFEGYAEPVFVPYQASSLALSPVPLSTAYMPNNLVANSLALGTSISPYQISVATGQTDPNSGTYAALLTEVAVSGYHSFQVPPVTVPAGAIVTWSAYLKQGGSRYFQLAVSNSGSGNPYAVFYANFDLQAGVVTVAGNGAVATISSAGNGYFRCAVSGQVDQISTTLLANAFGVNGVPTAGYAPLYTGSTSNTVDIAFPQVEVDISAGAPGAFNPTLATKYYGGPSVSVAGTYFDPTTYTINSNGAIVFASAPASGAALTWTGTFAWPCRFDEDTVKISEFMYKLHELKSLKFSTELL